MPSAIGHAAATAFETAPADRLFGAPTIQPRRSVAKRIFIVSPYPAGVGVCGIESPGRTLSTIRIFSGEWVEGLLTSAFACKRHLTGPASPADRPHCVPPARHLRSVAKRIFTDLRHPAGVGIRDVDSRERALSTIRVCSRGGVTNQLTAAEICGRLQTQSTLPAEPEHARMRLMVERSRSGSATSSVGRSVGSRVAAPRPPISPTSAVLAQ